MAEKEETRLKQYLETQPHGVISVTEQEFATVVTLAEDIDNAGTTTKMQEALNKMAEHDGKITMLTIIAIDAGMINRAVATSCDIFSMSTRKAIQYLREEVIPKHP